MIDIVESSSTLVSSKDRPLDRARNTASNTLHLAPVGQIPTSSSTLARVVTLSTAVIIRVDAAVGVDGLGIETLGLVSVRQFETVVVRLDLHGDGIALALEAGPELHVVVDCEGGGQHQCDGTGNEGLFGKHG